jgi:hypothetical protein
MNRHDIEEAAKTIREVLAAVEEGKLTASSPQEIALLRRLEGAAVALEQAGDSILHEKS